MQERFFESRPKYLDISAYVLKQCNVVQCVFAICLPFYNNC